MFSLATMVDGWSILGASLIQSPTWRQWSRVLVNIIQFLANFGSIQLFPRGKLDDCSMLNIQNEDTWSTKRYFFLRRK